MPPGTILAFLLGIVVGAVGLLVVQAIRQRADETDVGSAVGGTVGRSGRTGSPIIQRRSRIVARHSIRIASATGSTIGLSASQPTIEVDGAVYHQLGDVPDDRRAAVVDSLRLGLDAVPEGLARERISAFLAGGTPGSGPAPTSPEV